jgi:hypothetical protein
MIQTLYNPSHRSVPQHGLLRLLQCSLEIAGPSGTPVFLQHPIPSVKFYKYFMEYVLQQDFPACLICSFSQFSPVFNVAFIAVFQWSREVSFFADVFRMWSRLSALH